MLNKKSSYEFSIVTHIKEKTSMKQNAAFLGVFTLFAALMSFTSASVAQETLSKPRQALVQAREYMQKNQWKKLNEVAPLASQDETLGAYPRYWQLRKDLLAINKPIQTNKIHEFLNNSGNDNLNDRLKTDWIIAAARRGDYQTAINLQPVLSYNASLNCATTLSNFKLGNKITSEQALDAFVPSQICWTMMDNLYAAKVLSWEQIRFKLRDILETNKTKTANRMAAVIFNAKQMQQYAALIKNPKQWLSKQATPSDKADIELVTLALARLSREKNREEQIKYIENNWAGKIPAEQLEWVYSQFGLIAALNVEPNAADWYRKSGDQPLTDYTHAWQVRSELRQNPIDWKLIKQSIDRMSQRQASEPVWVYWKGRALEQLGDKSGSMQLYASIADDLSFYGQLANEDLGHTPFIPTPPKSVSSEMLNQARSNIGLQRAIEMFDLGWRIEAVQQWVFAIKGFSDEQLLAAAEFAKEQHVYDRVVNTSLLTKELIDFNQRFIAPFQGRVTEKANLISLDPAWVYGLIRQESRFIMDAKSRVGASGLMQLMPATAKWVAKKIGMTDFKPSMVNEFETNTILGTNYLRMVLDQLGGSEVLASAGYNAGPGRPIQWRSKLLGPVEGAIFAETIPFTETRLYVKNVMSNAVYYSMMFTGQPQSLRARLGIIEPKASKNATTP